jgi:hypothetical protein
MPRSLRSFAAVAASLLALGVLAMGVGSANADPLQHFTGTFAIQCGSDTLVLVAKPGSSNIVTINEMPSNGVSILMGATVTVSGVVVLDFHKPFTEHQDVTVCTDLSLPPGVTAVYEVLNTPPQK